jgi:hypothetical protein
MSGRPSKPSVRPRFTQKVGDDTINLLFEIRFKMNVVNHCAELFSDLPSVSEGILDLMRKNGRGRRLEKVRQAVLPDCNSVVLQRKDSFHNIW